MSLSDMMRLVPRVIVLSVMWTAARRVRTPLACTAKEARPGTCSDTDCDWPVCGCDPYANRVIDALRKMDALAKVEIGL